MPAAVPPTPEQIKAADDDYQAAVAAQVTALTDYSATLAPFAEKRKALVSAVNAVAEKRSVLAKLVAASVDPTVPPVPADEE